MIDAYTIGITLALQDGVSEGIVAIRRDLAALDTAIAASAAQLLMLRKLASEMPIPLRDLETVRSASRFARPASDRPPAQPSATASDVAQVTTSAAPSAPASSLSTVPASAAAETLSVPHNAAAPPSPLPSAAIERTVVSVLANPVPSAGMAPPAPPRLGAGPPAGPQIASAALADGPHAIAQHVSATPIAAPVPAAPIPQSYLSPTPSQPDARAGGDLSSDFAAIARALAPSMPAMTNATLRPLKEPVADSALPATPPLMIMTAVPSKPSQLDTTNRADARPTATSVPMPPPRRSDVPKPGAAPRQSAAPVMSVQVPRATSSIAPSQPNRLPPATEAFGIQQPDQPTYAELHLDGAALGRWVGRYLERQVTRPQAGATGFDPRITPSWSGAPIGN